AVVVGGNLLLEQSGIVGGNAVVTGGEIIESGGRVRGEMRVMSAGGDTDVRWEQGPGPLVVEGARPQGEVQAMPARNEHRDRFWPRALRHGFAGIMRTL